MKLARPQGKCWINEEKDVHIYKVFSLSNDRPYIVYTCYNVINCKQQQTEIYILSPFHSELKKKMCVISISLLEIYIVFLLLGFVIERSSTGWNEVSSFGTKSVNSFLLILIFLGKIVSFTKWTRVKNTNQHILEICIGLKVNS